MKLNVLQIILFLVFPVVLNAQSFEVLYGDTINVVDRNNLKQGLWVEMNDGVKIQEGNYIDNKKEGIWHKYYPNGTLAYKASYVKGRPAGKVCFYYESGEILEEGTWKNDHWVGEFKFYHKNGNLSYLWLYNDFGRRTGEQKYYYETGQLKIKGNWKDGIKEGEVREYHKDGSLWMIKNYTKGRLLNEDFVVYDEGKKFDEQVYSEPASIGVFDGNGYYQLYNKNKKIDREGEFRKGKLVDGKRYYYSKNGTLIKSAIYQNSKVISVIEHNEQ